MLERLCEALMESFELLRFFTILTMLVFVLHHAFGVSEEELRVDYVQILLFEQRL